MFLLSLVVAGIVALLAWAVRIPAVKMTLQWLKNRITEKLSKLFGGKVAVFSIKKLIEQCEKDGNSYSLEEFNKIESQGFNTVMTSIDKNNNVTDVDLIEGIDKDSSVKRLLDKGNGMLIINN